MVCMILVNMTTYLNIAFNSSSYVFALAEMLISKFFSFLILLLILRKDSFFWVPLMNTLYIRRIALT